MDSRKVLLTVYLVLVAVVLTCSTDASAKASPKIFKVRQEDSQVGFSIYKWLVIKEEGRFKNFEGKIFFDPDNPLSFSVDFTVQAGSVDSRNPDRDTALRSKDFFDVEKYPTLTFKSVRAVGNGKENILLTGDFTIRGVTKRITVPVKVLGINIVGGELGELAGFETSFTINRLDYGVGPGWKVLGNDVTIHLLIGAGIDTRSASR